MITLQNDKQLVITVGNSRKSTAWNPLTLTVSELYGRLETPMRGTEPISDYLSMSKADQDSRKDIGGFVGGRLNGQRRKADAVVDRCVVTLDFDTVPPYGTETVIAAVEALGCGYCIYSTRKHRPEAPRLRIVVVTDRLMGVDEYDAVSRRLAADIGITMADPTTFEVNRLMYWPSCCADGEYIFRYKDAPFLSVDDTLARYTDWKDWNERPQVPGTATSYKKLAVRQGDPESKSGIIGAFCRVYDVYRAMDELLPGVYAPVDTDPNRFTYLNGSTTGGAIVYDGGKFLYSHHATDPCSGRLVNAADLVRLHKFGHLDVAAQPDTPVNRLPSYKAFTAFAAADAEVSALMLQERYEAGQREFAGVTGGDSGEDSTAWVSDLQLTQQGAIKQTIDNVCIILNNDPLLKNRIALNVFADRAEGTAPVPWGSHSEEKGKFCWVDADDAGLCGYLEKRYGITRYGVVQRALENHLAQHKIDPPKDYINSLEWDGTPRLDTLFIDYLGAEDNSYTRTVTRKIFTAAVARIMEPGCKFDNMPILVGPQGTKKSTLINIMAGDWFTDSIKTFEGKEAAELIQGVWLVEIAELHAFGKSDENRIKQFISAKTDRYRVAYGHRPADHPRRCVFFGTSNPKTFLRDVTGARRFWPVYINKQAPIKEVFKTLPIERDQLWAEAKARWQMGEPLRLNEEQEAQAREVQEFAREEDPHEGMIRDFLDKPIPADWGKWSIDRRRDWWAGGVVNDNLELTTRDKVCVMEIWCEVFNFPHGSLKQKDSREINSILENVPGWERASTKDYFGPYGQQRGFIRKTTP